MGVSIWRKDVSLHFPLKYYPDGYVKGKLGAEHITAEHRLAMCSLAVSDSKWLEVCNWDATLKGYASTRKVISKVEEILKTKIGKKIKCYWLCGADHAIRIRMWEKVGSHILCVARKGSDIKKRLDDEKNNGNTVSSTFIVIEEEVDDISSTIIRQKIKQGVSLEGLVHPKVGVYLNNLYKK